MSPKDSVSVSAGGKSCPCRSPVTSSGKSQKLQKLPEPAHNCRVGVIITQGANEVVADHGGVTYMAMFAEIEWQLQKPQLPQGSSRERPLLQGHRGCSIPAKMQSERASGSSPPCPVWECGVGVR